MKFFFFFKKGRNSFSKNNLTLNALTSLSEIIFFLSQLSASCALLLPSSRIPFSAVVSFTSPAQARPFSLSSLLPSLPSQSSPSSHFVDVVVAVSLPSTPPSQKPCNRRRRLSNCNSKGYYSLLGKFCGLVIPSSLIAIDHWSPEVKGQGMVWFAHLEKNVASEIGSYADVILDACCQNIGEAN
ncbi:hypothetical protein Ahy_A05g025401 isoform A [Arachis hypogaea]|uniref:Uncharacterized protein n=1 Tax=Arachis hypogaea TaxID=3818 RepID=A0A445D8K8_ARAHY|nr:hypothetical protein Ahy_A05g025401 isoform A [Arachis hypogaea]